MTTPKKSLEDVFSLKGRVALVTGSSTGLGKAMAISLGRAGAKVALNYQNNTERAERTISEYKALGYEGEMYQGDVTDEKEVKRLTDKIAEELGPIDILVLNATCDQPHYPIEGYSWDFYQLMLDFFIKSPYLFARACLPHMKQQKWGRIINIGSEVFRLGMPDFSAYVAAKGGQNGWTRSMASELATYGITVNIVSPGWIQVERHEKEPQEWKDAYFPTIPAGRWGLVEDMEGVVNFLASESASFITGQNIHVSGGKTVG